MALAVEDEAEEVVEEVVVDSKILMGVDQAIIKDAVLVEGEEVDQTIIIHQQYLMESNRYTVFAFITQEMAAAAMVTRAGGAFINRALNLQVSQISQEMESA